MHNRSDQFSKNVLRDALSRVSVAETEVEVMAATQKIDVYSVPDPAREIERAAMGLLGELSAEPSLFEPYHGTPTLRQMRDCLRKQLTWHHELERRARAAAGSASPEVESEEPPSPPVPFPSLVVIGRGRPETVLQAYRCEPIHPGVYDAVPGLATRVVVLAELERTRETLLLRLLGPGRLLLDALADLAALPPDAWEKGVAMPLVIHFRLTPGGRTVDEEDDVSAEIQAWFQEYQQNLRKEGERDLILRQLHARFGELPAAAVARIHAAEKVDLERWAERLLTAQTLADVFDEPS